MNHDPTGLQKGIVPPLPSPCLPTLIRDNPTYFVENLPRRFAEEELGHRAAKVKFIEEVVCLYEHGEEHPEIYIQIRDTDYFRKAKQKYKKSPKMKLIMFHMMQPKIESNRVRAGKYWSVAYFAVNAGCKWHQVGEFIKKMGGIQKAYSAASAEIARKKKILEKRVSTQEDLSNREAESTDSAQLVPEKAENSRRSISRHSKVEANRRKPRFSEKVLIEHLLVEQNSLTRKAVTKGGHLRLLVEIGPRVDGFRNAKILKSRFRPKVGTEAKVK